MMATKLLARAERQSDKAKLKSLPALRRAAAKIARALGVLLEIGENTGETPTHVVFVELKDPGERSSGVPS